VREHDEGAIRDVVRRWGDAWNRHDMAAMAMLLTADADFVNVAARHWKGRNEIEREHAQRHQAHFKESVWATQDVAVQFLAMDLALVHVKWRIANERNSDGTPRQPRDGVFSWLMARDHGVWQIRAAHNTNAIVSPARQQ
jgi:uncharacterized protein (TIGR02246 family)